MPPYPVDHVVAYGTHAEQLADVRLPAAEVPTALVLLIHGGFWRQEWDRHHTDVVAADLATRGCAVATVEYRRLGGDGGWPTTFDDLAVATDQVPELVAAVAPSVAGRPVVLMGHSAGGHLALWSAGRHRLPVESSWHRATALDVRAVVALAPVADLAAADTLQLDDAVVAELLAGAGSARAARMAELDPMRLPPDARVVIVHGDRDVHVPLALAQSYLAAARAGGAEVELDVVVGSEHFALIEPGSAAWARVIGALDRVLGPPTPRGGGEAR